MQGVVGEVEKKDYDTCECIVKPHPVSQLKIRLGQSGEIRWEDGLPLE